MNNLSSETELFDSSESFNLNAIIQKYLRYWYWFLLVLFLSFLCAFIYLRYATPIYSVSSTVLIKDDKKAPGVGDNPALQELDIFQSGKSIDNEIEILKGKTLMQRVVKELSLETSYFTEGRVKTVELYRTTLPIRLIVSRLDSTAFDQSILLHIQDRNTFEVEEADGTLITYKFGQQVKMSYATFTVTAVDQNKLTNKTIEVKFNDLRKVAAHYNENLNVSPVNKQASVLTISLLDPVPQKGIDVINKLVDLYNREEVEDKNIIATNTIRFIDERLKYLVTELSGVERNVEQYKRSNEVTDVSLEAQQYQEQAGDYNKRLADYEIQISVLESLERYLSKPGSHNDLVPSNLSAQDVTLSSLIAKFNELQLERNRILTTVQAESPLVKSINEQLINLRANILENLKNIRKSLVITRDNLKSSSSTFERRIRTVPSIERALLDIQREKSIKEALYSFLLQKREESALSLASSVSNSRTIDHSMADEVPVKPKRPLVYLLALILGIGFPIGIIYLRDLLNDKIRSADDVPKVSNVPILGELGHHNGVEPLVITKHSRTPISEMFRLIRTNLQFATVGGSNKVMLVTSSMGGEGKTFFSKNLGASLALIGKRVVLLEFDIRKPRLLRSLNINGLNPGITNYLISDKLTPADLIQPVGEEDNLFVIGAGPIPPNPGELLLSNKIQILFSELRETFDYIIVDTSPVGLVADAFSLMSYADTSVYMVRYNYTPKGNLGIIKDIYENKKLKNPMVVLNDAKKENTYGYGYGYGYGEYGQEEKTQNRNILKRLFKRN